MSAASFPSVASLHQCSDKHCGGTFTCYGCERIVGWCFGAGDELGEEHCDDCWKERHDLLAFLADGPCSPAKLERRFGGSGWRQSIADMLRSLKDEHFIYRVSRGYALTILGREAL